MGRRNHRPQALPPRSNHAPDTSQAMRTIDRQQVPPRTSMQQISASERMLQKESTITASHPRRNRYRAQQPSIAQPQPTQQSTAPQRTIEPDVPAPQPRSQQGMQGRMVEVEQVHRTGAPSARAESTKKAKHAATNQSLSREAARLKNPRRQTASPKTVQPITTTRYRTVEQFAPQQSGRQIASQAATPPAKRKLVKAEGQYQIAPKQKADAYPFAAAKRNAANGRQSTAKRTAATSRFDVGEKKPLPARPKSLAKSAAAFAVSAVVYDAIEDSTADNYATDAMRQTAQTVDSARRTYQRVQSHQNTRRGTATNARNHTPQSAQAAKQARKKALQKKRIQREYQKAKHGKPAASWAVKFAQNGKETLIIAAKKALQLAVSVKLSIGGAVLLIGLLCVILVVMIPSCGMLSLGVMTSIISTTYTSEDEDTIATDDAYSALEAALQAEIDAIPTTHSGYDEYRYVLDAILHDPHELAAYLHALDPYYTAEEMAQELLRVLEIQYDLTLIPSSETRYRTETRQHSNGDSYTVQVPYTWTILTVTLVNHGVEYVAYEVLDEEQLEMYEVRRLTLGNKPLLFGGGSADTSPSTDLSGVEFEEGTCEGNGDTIDIALDEIGNTGGEKYWSWYGFDSRVAWCAIFVSWCLDQAGYDEPQFAACQNQGIPWFQSNGQWADSDYTDIAEGDLIFFDWIDNDTGSPDGYADHVGLVVGTDGEYVYTVEGNSGDTVATRKYSLDDVQIVGYGIMNAAPTEGE